MRDPLHRTPLRGNLLQRILARFPDIDVSAVDAAAAIEHAAGVVTTLAFLPLAEHGMSRGRFRVMIYLTLEEELEKEPPSPSIIAENLGVTRATMTDLLDGLERDGIIERRQAGRDRRAQAIHLTDVGKRLFDRMIPPLTKQLINLFAPLTVSERHILIALLTKLTAQNATSLDQ